MTPTLLLGSKRPNLNVVEALAAHGLDAPAETPVDEAIHRLRAGGVLLVLSDPEQLSRPEVSAALRQAGCPPVFVLGGSHASGTAVDDLSMEDTQKLVASLPGCWHAMRPALIAAVAQELSGVTSGPLAPRVKGVISRLAQALGTQRLALFASEAGQAQILPRLAEVGDTRSMPQEICIGTEEVGLIAARREPARIGNDLLLPMVAGDHVNGLLWMAAPEEGPALGLARSAASLLGVVLDRTAHGRGERVVSLDGEQLMWVEKLASLGQLAAGIAHEINNPLFVISGNLELVQRGLDKRQTDLVQRAQAAAERIRRIVFEMRQFYLPTSHSERITNLDLNALIVNAIEVISLQAPFQGVTFVQDLDPKLPEVTGDDNQLLQVLTHLFLNSAQAMPDGGEIRVRTYVEKGRVTIEVKDEGVGIPKAHQKRVFDPFFTTKQDWLGTGLGLSVSHTIVRNHGGTIELDSEENKGATFWVRLPGPKKPSGRIAVPRKARPKRVLVADDEGTVRDFMEYLLRDQGYEVDLAPDGAAALALLEKAEYGVVMMDNLMPGLSGQEAGREIVSRYPGLPVILVTGAVSVDAGDLSAEGFFRVLPKPCKADDIIEAVKAAVGA